MPIEAFVSSSPCLGYMCNNESEPRQTWFHDLHGPEGWRSWWIIPTSRRRRAVFQNVSQSMRLPRAFTFDGLVQHLTSLSNFKERTIGNTGRLLRIAKAFREADPNSPLTVGRVHQIDQATSQWRASQKCAPADNLLGVIQRKYDEMLSKDNCLDAPAQQGKLASELKDPTGPLARLVCGRRIYFDGYHRFSHSELELIQSLGIHSQVRLWLVGVKSQVYDPNVERILNQLQITTIFRDSQLPANDLAIFGRSLFYEDAGPSAEVECYLATNREEECRAVAASIKGDVRARTVRLSDIALVIPDDSYLPLVKESLASAGIHSTPSAEMFTLSDSRPARTLLTVLKLIRLRWPVDAVFDFLRQPLVFRRLEERHGLEWLCKRSSVAATLHSASSWLNQWQEQIDDYERNSLTGDRDSDEDSVDRIERVKSHVAALRKLCSSVGSMLAPVSSMEQEISGSTRKNMKRMIHAIAQWLDNLALANQLSPTGHPDWAVVPYREWEIDQLAFNNLKDVLAELNDLPERDLPLTNNQSVDLELVMNLALAAETFQTSAEDDAGVQIVRAPAIRGSRFRTIYVVGLVEGVVPHDPGYPLEKDDVGTTKRLWREEDLLEQRCHFAQIFESASERIILSRPEKHADVPLMESPYLRIVRQKLSIDKIPTFQVNGTVDVRDALADSKITAANATILSGFLEVRKRWNQRQAHTALQIETWALPLLHLRYPEDRPFSATSLERYASCPFQHFSDKTLGLEDQERDDSAMRWGLFVHDVLDEAFRVRDSRPMHESFRATFDKRWSDVASTLDLTYRHDFHMALFAAYEAVAQFLEQNKFAQIESEWERKSIRISDGVGRSILLHVKIDRIDRRESDGVELICDFKTGLMAEGSKLLRKIETGRALQLPLYGLARQTETGESVKHGIYVKLSRRVDGERNEAGPFLIQLAEIQPTKKRVKIPFDPQQAGNIAIELASKMRAGRIELTSFDVDDKDPACGSYCSARHACRHPKGY
jgi:ATP-dependent helicase/DNAse subunit B